MKPAWLAVRGLRKRLHVPFETMNGVIPFRPNEGVFDHVDDIHATAVTAARLRLDFSQDYGNFRLGQAKARSKVNLAP